MFNVLGEQVALRSFDATWFLVAVLESCLFLCFRWDAVEGDKQKADNS